MVIFFPDYLITSRHKYTKNDLEISSLKLKMNSGKFFLNTVDNHVQSHYPNCDGLSCINMTAALGYRDQSSTSVQMHQPPNFQFMVCNNNNKALVHPDN